MTTRTRETTTHKKENFMCVWILCVDSASRCSYVAWKMCVSYLHCEISSYFHALCSNDRIAIRFQPHSLQSSVRVCYFPRAFPDETRFPISLSCSFALLTSESNCYCKTYDKMTEVENGSCGRNDIVRENNIKRKVFLRTFFSPNSDIFRVDPTHADSNSDYELHHHQESSDVEAFDE